MSAEEDNMEARRFYIITGGTMVHVAPHFSLCAPAYGKVGVEILEVLQKLASKQDYGLDPNDIILLRTKMALGSDDLEPEEQEIYEGAGVKFLETNEDLAQVLDYLVERKDTGGIILAAAVCDWKFRYTVQKTFSSRAGSDGLEARCRDDFGKHATRLQTKHGEISAATLMPTDKLIQKIRAERKDIFLVGFKATTGMTEQEQYLEGLNLLKSASCNLVFANDVHDHRNMVITPEEAKYEVTKNRRQAIHGLCEMILLRSQLTFTRSIVVDGPAVPWDDKEIPENLRTVVNYCIERGAYKPFRGSTVGHFAARGPKKDTIFTSRRKSNFNNLAKDGLLKVELRDKDTVVAYGGKPSVGGQSQRIIFDEHPDVDCIVHFHCPLRPWDGAMPRPPVRPQRPFECGSHECGKNTSDGLKDMVTPRRYTLKAVMLDEHGPNICFSRNADPKEVIDFIETFWDLEAKTGGPVEIRS
jgi:hypothetical protein